VTAADEQVRASAARDRLVAAVAERLLRVGDDALDARIHEALQTLGQHLDADRVYIVETEEAGERLQFTHQWTHPAVDQARETGVLYDMTGYPWLRRIFLAEGSILLRSLADMPSTADLERASLQKQGVVSMIVADMGVKRPSSGSIGVQAVRGPRDWTPEDVALVTLVGQLMCAALTRRVTSQALASADARQRAILRGLPDSVFVLSAEGMVTDVHAPTQLGLPITQETIRGSMLTTLLPDAIARPVLDKLKHTLLTGTAQTVQYNLPIQGQPRHLEVRFAPRHGEDVLVIVRDISERIQAEQQLKEQERLYEILVHSTLDAIVLCDEDGHILSWNPGAARMFGYMDADVVGKDLSHLAPEYLTGDTDDLTNFMASGRSGMVNHVVELTAVRRSGDEFPAEMTLSAYTSNQETLLACVIRDITERRSAERALVESEQRYRQLVQNSADGILLHDESGCLVDVNDRTVEMLGYSRETLLGMSMIELERHTLPEVHTQFWRNMHFNQAVTLEGVYQRRDGSAFPVEMRLAKFHGGSTGHLILVIARDITERKARDTEQMQHREQLRHLASQLTLTEEQQRRELAVQLHDGIGQELAMCRLRIQSYQSEPPERQDPGHLEHALKYVKHAIQRVHSLTFDISPPALHELGLAAALRSLGRRIQEDHNLRFQYEQSGEETDIPKELEVLLFRTVRELAINVVKHAQASTLRVSMRTGRAQVEIAVADDGIGIDPDRLLAQTQPAGAGFGLFSVRERLSSVQGALELHQAGGTVATIMVPLDEHTPYAYMLGGSGS